MAFTGGYSGYHTVTWQEGGLPDLLAAGALAPPPAPATVPAGTGTFTSPQEARWRPG